MNTETTEIKNRGKLQFASGDTLRVWTKIKDNDGKTRLQAFEGLVLARKHGSSTGGTFTIRKVSNGIGVERIFPLYSTNIDKIEVVRQAKTRRSKLYYVREKAVKDVRRRIKQDLSTRSSGEVAVEAEMAESTEQTATE
jgi:large subunit ribosomal protein L19